MLDIEQIKERLARGAAIDYDDTKALLEEVGRLQKAVIGLLWGCENAGMRPYPAYDDARRALGSRDPLRFIRGPVDEEEVPDADRP